MEAYIAGVSGPTDFKGKPCVFVFFGGCDFQCPFCYVPNYIEFKNEYLVSLRDVKKEINQYPIDWVVFSGGEPCLQRQAMLDIARHCQKCGIKVAVETNGSRPDALKSLIRDKLVNFIALDIKAPLNDPDLFESVTMSKNFFRTTTGVISNIRETLKILTKTNAEIEARTTVIPKLMYRKNEMLEIAKVVNDLNVPWVLQRFRNNSPLVNRRFNEIEEPSMTLMEDLKNECMKVYPRLFIDIV